MGESVFITFASRAGSLNRDATATATAAADYTAAKKTLIFKLFSQNHLGNY